VECLSGVVVLPYVSLVEMLFLINSCTSELFVVGLSCRSITQNGLYIVLTSISRQIDDVLCTLHRSGSPRYILNPDISCNKGM
jgi:hypothetical protein